VPVIAALYPVGMLLLQLLVAVLLGWLAATVLALLPVPGVLGTVVTVLSYALWAAVSVTIMRWFQCKDSKFFAYYLMHDYSYSARWNGANPPPNEERIAQFADQIAAALGTEVDEVLVVGHSFVAHLDALILADLHRAGREPADGPALAFLSLG
jgi:2-polyprenyl-6-methoxyphenol hydroxylase-like FAD-dependent oxidoreductase